MSTFDGTMGTKYDEFGNDKEEEALEFIQKQHALYLKGGFIEEARNHLQMYPMSLKDAFLARSADKLWPIVNINEAIIAEYIAFNCPPFDLMNAHMHILWLDWNQ